MDTKGILAKIICIWEVFINNKISSNYLRNTAVFIYWSASEFRHPSEVRHLP